MPSTYDADSEPRAHHAQTPQRQTAARPTQHHRLMRFAGRVRDVIIVGSGPAGYTAAIHTARAGLDTLVVEGEVSSMLLTVPIEPCPQSGWN